MVYNLHIPGPCQEWLDQLNERTFDDTKIAVYRLDPIDLQEQCRRATKIYRDTIGPKGFRRPIFKWRPTGQFLSLDNCFQHFLLHLDLLMRHQPIEKGRNLNTYPGVCVVFSRHEPEHAFLVFLHKPNEQEWQVDCGRAEVKNLGMVVTSLMLESETREEVLELVDECCSICHTVGCNGEGCWPIWLDEEEEKAKQEREEEQKRHDEKFEADLHQAGCNGECCTPIWLDGEEEQAKQKREEEQKRHDEKIEDDESFWYRMAFESEYNMGG